MTSTTIPQHHASDNRLWSITASVTFFIWFAIVALLTAQGSLQLLPGPLPMVTLTAVILPPALALFALFSFRSLREAVLDIDPVFLTTLQSWRIMGSTFLILYFFGHLPAFFAWPAGLGDALTGMAAPFAAYTLMKAPQKALTSRKYLYFNLFGLTDFVFAIGTGIIARNHIPGLVEGITSSAMGEFPLVLIPTFIVPVFIIIHLMSLLHIWNAHQEKSAPV